MKLRLGKNPAMMTVELGVSLVLIIVVLFVVIGLFNDNIKSMIGSSNFARLFSANGIKTFFQSFNRNYDDSQIYVQIMGEQGLKMLRQKANNNDLSLLDAAQQTGIATNSRTANTILYLAQVINIIVGNQEICNKITNISDSTSANATCSTLGLGVKYTVSGGGTLLTITDSSGATLKLTLSKSFDTPTISANANAKDKLAAIQQLAKEYGANIDSSYAMTREINNFSSTASNLGGKTIEDEIAAVLRAEISSLQSAHDGCYDNSFGVPDKFKSGCGLNSNTVGPQELSDATDLINNLIAQITTMSKLADTYKTASFDSTAYLPSIDLPKPYTPTINIDNWYSANAIDSALIAGSEDALLMASAKDDPLALLAPSGEEPIFEGSFDAIMACNSGDTKCQACQAAGGTGGYNASGCVCSAGKSWNGSACVNGGSGSGSSGTTCPADSLFDDINLRCVTCPAPGQLDLNGTCCDTGAVDNSGACCASGFLDQTGNCGSSGGTTICPLSTTGMTTSCSGTTALSITYTNIYTTPSGLTAVSPSTMTSPANTTFDQNYVKSNLNTNGFAYDSRLTLVSNAINRIKILTVYNDMINKLITNSDLLFFLRQDNYNATSSCDIFKSGLRTISKERGLTSINSLITDSICNANDGPNLR